MTRAKVSHASPATINPVGKMVLSKKLVRILKAELRSLHRVYSWREMAKEIYKDEVKFGTLERFATDPLYIPKDEKILKALNLLVPPNPYRNLPHWYHRTQAALDFFNAKRTQIKSMSAKTHQAHKDWKSP